jgi:uncharacterized membrane protein YccC
MALPGSEAQAIVRENAARVLSQQLERMNARPAKGDLRWSCAFDVHRVVLTLACHRRLRGAVGR